MTDPSTPPAAPTPTEIDAIRQREQAATGGPWIYDSYSGIFSGPKVKPYDEWTDALADGHSLERHGKCDTCNVGTTQGCRLFTEAYNRDPLVAHVPAHHGDTATGMHAADAEFISHARQDIPALLADNARLRAELDAARPILDAAAVWAGLYGSTSHRYLAACTALYAAMTKTGNPT